MLKSKISSRLVTGRVALFAVIGSFLLIFTAAGASAAGFSFTDSAKEFFGLSTTMPEAVLGGASPTPTCTPSEHLADGTFEAGSPWTAWTIQTSDNFLTPLCNTASCGTGGGLAPPFAGDNWAWFGGIGAPETSTLGQTLTIPAGAPATLSFQMRVGKVTSPFTDTLVVRIDGTVITTFTEPAVAEAGYTLRSFDVSSFANGASHALLFTYTGTTTGTSSFTVDNISLLAGATCFTPTPTSTSTPTNTPTNTSTGTPSPTPTNTATSTATATTTTTNTPTNTPTSTPTGTPPCGGGMFSYTGPAVSVADNDPTGVNLTIPVSGVGNVTDLNFRFDGIQNDDPTSTTPGINHSWVGDLLVTITSPGGTTVAAFDRPGVPASTFGCDSNNLAQLVLDDAGGFPSVEDQCTDGDTAFPTGSFSPNNPLSAFNGQNPNGNWTINVSDNAGGDTGSVRAVSLIIGSGCTTQTPTPTATATSTPTPAAVISGTVTYGNAIPAATRFVSHVLISAAGSTPLSVFTGTGTGTYALTGFGSGAYTITPTKTGASNGSITSFDAARIAQHVAGVTPLTGNQLIVADVSGNGTISSFDAGEVAGYTVSVQPTGNTGNWIFQPVNRTYASITTSQSGQDYSALLMGEVSGNWTDNGTRPARTGPERNTAVKLPRLVTPADSEVIIPVNVQGAADKGIISYEFDLRYDASVIQPQANTVDMAGTVSSKLSVVANTQEAGLLRVAVYGAMPIKSNGLLMNLKFTSVGAAGSVSPLTWERLVINEGDPMAVVTDGQVELSAAAPNQAEISGRLLTAMGQGVANARVTLTDTTGQSRSILSNGFGVYRFGGLQVGQTYTVSVDSKRLSFTPLTVSVTGQLASMDMIAGQ